jgi:hypothetical protein
MRDLNFEEIDTLASRKGVRRVAVVNFLSTLGHAGSKSGELYNLSMDAGLYKWNSATQNAIRRGIEISYK